jgi:hypothetical protein
MTKDSNVKIVEEVSRERLKCIVYASFFCGFLAARTDQRSLDAPDNFKEIKSLIEQISK